MDPKIKTLIEKLRNPNYLAQAAAARQLGELADAAAEQALLNSFWGNTYQLIDQDGSPGRYHAIISSAAKALAQLNTNRAFDALVSRVQQNKYNDQLGTAAAVYGLSFSSRAGVVEIIRSVVPRPNEDSGAYLADEIFKALSGMMADSRDHADPNVEVGQQDKTK